MVIRAQNADVHVYRLRSPSGWHARIQWSEVHDGALLEFRRWAAGETIRDLLASVASVLEANGLEGAERAP